MNEPIGSMYKYVGLASDSDSVLLYALREDGALYEIHWEGDQAKRRLLCRLPQSAGEE